MQCLLPVSCPSCLASHRRAREVEALWRLDRDNPSRAEWHHLRNWSEEHPPCWTSWLADLTGGALGDRFLASTAAGWILANIDDAASYVTRSMT